MQPTFDRYDVEVVAISKDTVAQAAAHRARDGLDMTLLSDPELSVIQAYGLEHHKAVEFTTFTVFGIPLGWPHGFTTMAIPTTILVDAEGIVRWVDQADDYRVRGDAARVEAALAEFLG